MDILIEIIGEFLLESFFEIIKNKKISKWIRYPLAILLFTFYAFIIFVIAYIGIDLLHDNKVVGIILILISLILLISILYILKKQA